MARDRIFLEDLEVDCIIGVNDWERMVKQTVRISFVIPCDAGEAARTDDVEDAVDYKAVSKWIIDYVEDSEYFLLETLAEETARGCLRELELDEIELTVEKPGAVRHSRTVGITIRRTRDDL